MSVSSSAKLASLLHPAKQYMVIDEVVCFNETTKMYILKSKDNNELAYFEAGCYIPVFVEIDGNVVERPYSLASSPLEAEQGIYKIVVKQTSGGYVSNYIINNWKENDEVVLGSPKEAEVYNPIRDKKTVVALAGGVGITPFHSMAKAVVDGDNDHNLVIIYGANTQAELLFKDEFDQLEKESSGKVKMVYVIANEEVEGCEKGFITLDIIQKHCNVNDVSFFISGPPAMIRAMKKALAPLNLARKFIRVSMNGDGGFNHSSQEATSYQLTIHMGGEVYKTNANSNETILVAIEKAGLKPAVYCRSGICGFCRSMVISGSFKLATDETGVRKMDQQFGFIHPCCSYPTSDLEIVVQRAK